MISKIKQVKMRSFTERARLRRETDYDGTKKRYENEEIEKKTERQRTVREIKSNAINVYEQMSRTSREFSGRLKGCNLRRSVMVRSRTPVGPSWFRTLPPPCLNKRDKAAARAASHFLTLRRATSLPLRSPHFAALRLYSP